MPSLINFCTLCRKIMKLGTIDKCHLKIRGDKNSYDWLLDDVIKIDVLKNCGFSLEMREFLKEIFYRY